jgi:hypothetical protein
MKKYPLYAINLAVCIAAKAGHYKIVSEKICELENVDDKIIEAAVEGGNIKIVKDLIIHYSKTEHIYLAKIALENCKIPMLKYIIGNLNIDFNKIASDIPEFLNLKGYDKLELFSN